MEKSNTELKRNTPISRAGDKSPKKGCNICFVYERDKSLQACGQLMYWGSKKKETYKEEIALCRKCEDKFLILKGRQEVLDEMRSFQEQELKLLKDKSYNLTKLTIKNNPDSKKEWIAQRVCYLYGKDLTKRQEQKLQELRE